MSLRTRIERVERSRGQGICPLCSVDLDGPVEVTLHDEGGATEDVASCLKCGWPRPMPFVIEAPQPSDGDNDA